MANASEATMECTNQENTEGQEWHLIESTKRKADKIDSSPSNQQLEKKGKPDTTLKPDENIVYIFSKTGNIAKQNPIKLKAEIISTIGPVNDIFIVDKKFLKIYCKTEGQKDKLNNTTFIGETEIEISHTRIRNPYIRPSIETYKAVIVGVAEDTDTNEIVSETKALTATRLYKGQGSTKTKTSAVLLTFEQPPPEFTYLGFTRFKLKEYRPTPFRCYKCQRFGHTAAKCNNRDTCPVCGGPHEYKNCPTGTEKHCVNCNGPHSAGYRGCPKYTEIQSNIITANKQKISYSEAAKLNLEQKNKRAESIDQTTVKTVDTNSTAQTHQIIRHAHTETTIETETQTDFIPVTSNQIKTSDNTTQTPSLNPDMIQYLNKIVELLNSKDKVNNKMETFKQITDRHLNIQINFDNRTETSNIPRTSSEQVNSNNSNATTEIMDIAQCMFCQHNIEPPTSNRDIENIINNTVTIIV